MVYICDECGKEFLEKEMEDCPVNGIDSPCKVCKSCCENCYYNVDGECEW